MAASEISEPPAIRARLGRRASRLYVYALPAPGECALLPRGEREIGSDVRLVHRHRGGADSSVIVVVRAVSAGHRPSSRSSRAQSPSAMSTISVRLAAPATSVTADGRAVVVDRGTLVRCHMTRPSTSAVLPTITAAVPRTHRSSRPS